MFHDVRYAARVLVKNKAWTSMIVLCLAIGIGANTALFSAINGMMIQKLAVSDPDTLVRFRYGGQNDMSNNRTDYANVGREFDLVVRATTSYPIYQAMQKANQTLVDMFVCAPYGNANAVVDGEAELAAAFIASGNYYTMLGVRAVLGRTILPEDDQPGAPAVAVISHGYWTRRFANDRGVIGKNIRVNNIPVTIVGVISADFKGVQRLPATAPDISLPLALDPQLGGEGRLKEATNWWLQVFGRLKPGATAAQVQANLEGVFRQAARDGMDALLATLSPEERASSDWRGRTQIPELRISSGARGMYDPPPQDTRALTILTIVVALLLCLVTANVANLVLARASARVKEVSVRLSLGASRARVIRQLLTESLLLAVIGGSFGLLVAAWGKELLPAPLNLVSLDWRVFAFMSALSLLTGILFGIVPSLRVTKNELNAGLSEGSRSFTASRTTFAKSLVVLQVAVSLLLLIGAGLFLRTVQNLRSVDVGFNPNNLVLFRVNPRQIRYEMPQIGALYDRMVDELKQIPGVKSVSFSSNGLMVGTESDTNLVRQSRADVPNSQNLIYQLTVSPGFFETMEMPIRAGRDLTASDNQGSSNVAVINETAAAKFFPNENPLGQRFGTSPETSSRFEVIGVVRDAKYNRAREAAPPTVYFLYSKRPVPAVTFEVRTISEPVAMMASIRQAVRKIDPNLPLNAVSTQLEQIDNRFSQERLFAQAYGVFGGIALLVASIGLFGLISYNVARRTKEIGIRLALGAQRMNVQTMVMRESFFMVGIGLIIGLMTAFMGGRVLSELLSTLLFGLAPTDAVTIVTAIVILTGVAGVASYLPARRAANVDPMVALRHE